ncbi:MAG: PIN domain-containing protein [Gammaproteobacteria bacterium]
MRLFVDTWGWIALFNKNESRHREVEAYFDRFQERGGTAYTTDYILDETFTFLFKRLPFPKAKNSLELLEQAIQQNYICLEWITPPRFEQAKALRLKFQDKPTISFTDLASMAVMNELGISDVLTADTHFIKVGMGFQIVP